MSFQKFSGDDTPDPYSGRGRLPPAPNTQRAIFPGAGRKRPGVATQTLVLLNFSAVVAPLSLPEQLRQPDCLVYIWLAGPRRPVSER